MGVGFKMYALPSFSSRWDENVLKCLLRTVNPTVVKMRIDSKKKTFVGGGGGAILDYFPRDINLYCIWVKELKK